MKVLTLFFGLQVDPDIQALGDTQLAVDFSPTFTSSSRGHLLRDIALTIPPGTTGPRNLTCGEFFTLGVS